MREPRKFPQALTGVMLGVLGAHCLTLSVTV